MLKNNLPIRTECKWIKGHGDSNERGELIHGPFNRKTQLNIWMDSLAAEGLRKSSEVNIRDQLLYRVPDVGEGGDIWGRRVASVLMDSGCGFLYHMPLAQILKKRLF